MDDRSRSGPASDFFVHLNCLSDSELYNNKSSCFTNNMKPPILLPFHTPYEVALSNIYFKQEFYQLLANEEESSIQLIFYILKCKASKAGDEASANSVENFGSENVEVIDKKILDKVYPSKNLIGDTKSILNEYNKQFQHQLMQYDELNMKISYNITSEHFHYLVDLNNLPDSNWFDLDLGDEKYGAFAVKFGRKIAYYLGYYPDKPFFLRCESKQIDIELLNALATKPSSSFESKILNPISNIFVYTNIVKRSRTGSQTTNLLEVVPFNTFSKNNSITIYKELSQFDIQYIKIQLTDEYGTNIPFLDNTYVAVDLHFRPKI